mgnify:CR=1 FL=1
MVTKTELSVSDMRYIIARFFGVPESDVAIEPYLATKGYGVGEHEAAGVRCTVCNIKAKKPEGPKNV